MTTRVIKLGGRAQGSAVTNAALAAAWRAAPGSFCIVHGGGDEISSLQRQLGSEPTFSGGRRVTTASDLAAVRMVLSGSANKRMVSDLLSLGVAACGVSGEDAWLLQATVAANGALGRVGTPSRVDPTILNVMLSAGLLPVISPVAREENASGGLNVNGDDAAAAIAIALGSAELLLLSDVPGVLVNGLMVGSMDVATAQKLIADGSAHGGMAAKLEAAQSALARGVPRVRIGDAALLGDPGAGTTVTATLPAAAAL